MKSVRHLFASAALFAAASAFAQTATLTASAPALDAGGGTAVLTATAVYDGTPGALGWSISLPGDWTFVGVVGPDLPAISPQVGATGKLEFAFTAPPTGRAEFTVQVRYPANSPTTVATSTVLLRAGGKLNTVQAAPLQLKGTVPTETRGSHN